MLLQLALSEEGFLIDFADVVSGCIQLYKRNYPQVPEECLVQGHKDVGNVEILHEAVKPEFHIKTRSCYKSISIIASKVFMYTGIL
jgi:hypothetical protein